MAKVIEWFASRPEPEETGGAAASALAAAPAFSLGLAAAGPVPETTAHALAELTAGIIASGGSVILPRSASLTGNPAFLEALGLEAPLADTLAYGQVGRHPGMHLMATPTAPLIEALTGLGGTGVHLILAHVADAPVQGHPLIPTLQVATAGSRAAAFAGDLDFVIDSGTADTGRIRDELLGRIRDTLAQDYAPRAWARGHTGFQLTRGLLGVSL
jgi:hypothetical protein